MRLIPVMIASALLAAGPVFAQEIALTRGKPQCPPAEPDSLQISWTAPCDSGTWLFEPGVGCRMWDWHPEPEDSVVWRGGCRAGLPDGKGEAQWFEHGRPIDRFIGTYVNGKREGEGHYQWNDTVRFNGLYANDLPQGYGVVEIEGETVAGDWNKGCLKAAGKVVAIGVQRASCGPVSGKGGEVVKR
jgi:hypothetical protein